MEAESHHTSTHILDFHVHQIRIHIHTRYRPGTQRVMLFSGISDVDQCNLIRSQNAENRTLPMT